MIKSWQKKLEEEVIVTDENRPKPWLSDFIIMVCQHDGQNL